MDGNGGTDTQLHVVFLPYMAGGHMKPLMDIARLFAAHDPNNNIKVTIITTPKNAPRDIDHPKIVLEILPFPWAEAGLPQGIENLTEANTPGLVMKFLHANTLLRPNIETLIRQLSPDCIVSDMIFSWTTHLAQELGIPRVVFISHFFFSMSVGHCIQHYQPQKNVESDTEPFVILGLPDQVVFTKSQLVNNNVTKKGKYHEFSEPVKEADMKYFGAVFNSFYELESGYADYWRNVVGIKAWHVGPVSLFCKKKNISRGEREEKDSVIKDSCLSWLDSKEPNSVLYACFGSFGGRFTKAQLTEIACALESTGHFFIWVIGKLLRNVGDEEEDEWWLPEGFEKRANESGKGMIIRGWAPQVLILEHEAIGGFMTHTGANSVLESVIAGVPMATWPLRAEQFQNEKLVTQVLKCGFPVGNMVWNQLYKWDTILIMRENIEKAVRKVMARDDEDAHQMRKNVKRLSELAHKAVEDGGSSANDLKALIQEIRAYVKK